MATTVLRPTGATFHPSAPSDYGVLGITGSPPQWGDESDATYTTHSTDSTSGSLAATGWAPMPLWPNLTGVTRIALYARASNLEGVENTVQAGLGDTEGLGILVAGTFSLPASGLHSEQLLEFTEVSAPTAQEVADALFGFFGDGSMDYVFAGQLFSDTDPDAEVVLGRIYETWVEIDTPDPDIAGADDGVRRIFL